MRKLFVIAVLFTSVAFTTKAQMYTSSIGLRMGLESGLTFKHFISDNSAFEGLVSTRWNEINLTGLYEIHNLAFDIDGLFWYYGGGIHAGFGNSYSNDFVAGLDGIIGIEYTIRDYPVNISLDWKPSFDIVGNINFWGAGGTALSVRYIFK